MCAEGDFFQLSSLGVEPAAQPVHPYSVDVEAAACRTARGKAGALPGHDVVMPPRRQQRFDGVFEHRVEHGNRR